MTTEKHRHPDECEKCGHYHRYMISCDEARMTREHVCDYCNSSAKGGSLERLRGHPRNSRLGSGNPYSSQGTQAYRCPKCGAIWLCRYQFDEGTGSDNEWFIIELPKAEETDAS